MKPIYLWINEQAEGPYSPRQIYDLWRQLKVDRQTLYATENAKSWQPLGEIWHLIMVSAPQPSAPDVERTLLAPATASPLITFASRPGTVARKFELGCFGCMGTGIAFVALIVFIALFNNSGPRDSVTQSAWNGSVRQAEQWLRTNLKDPGSLEIIEWSPVEKLPTGYAVRCKYRAKNSFGGYAIENKLFMMDSSGAILDVKDY